MKKLILIFVAVLGLTLLPAAVQAQGFDQACQGAAASSPVCQEAQSTNSNPLVGPNGIITRVTQLVVIVVGIAAVIMIIISGLRYITSAGDPAGVNGAKNGIIYAVVGLVVAVVGQIIVSLVLAQL